MKGRFAEMTDIYDNIFNELSRRLSKEGDRTLLKTLISVQREGGKDAVKKKLKMIIQEISGE